MQVSEMSNVRWAEEDVTRYSDGESAEDSESVRGKQVALGEHRIAPAPPVQIQILDPRLLATAPVGTINVHKSKGVTIGTNISNITVDNREKVKGHFVGLELVSLVDRSRAVRCSFAVCACWIFIVAAGVLYFLLHAIFATESKVIDLGINNSWYFRREDWQALDVNEKIFLDIPVEYVVIGHSGQRYCNATDACIKLVLEMQKDHIVNRRWSDIAFNFLVAGNGFVYEGRGSNVIGAILANWNSRIISIGFIGNYMENTADDAQFKHTQILINQLVRIRVLKPEHKVRAKCQFTGELSPGASVTKRMNEFKNWDDTGYANCPLN